MFDYLVTYDNWYQNYKSVSHQVDDLHEGLNCQVGWEAF